MRLAQGGVGRITISDATEMAVRREHDSFPVDKKRTGLVPWSAAKWDEPQSDESGSGGGGDVRCSRLWSTDNVGLVSEMMDYQAEGRQRRFVRQRAAGRKARR